MKNVVAASGSRRSFLHQVACGAAALSGLAGGCEGTGSVEQYVPAEVRAREALETALNAWKAGGAEGDERALPDGVKVRVLDRDWREEGRKLVEFTILEAKPSSGAEPRQFHVRLVYQGAAQSVEADYYVAGIDPLLVFRDVDYQRTSGL